MPLDDGALEVEVASLGDAALAELLAAADPESSPHPVVAKALLELADSVRVGERYDAVTFDAGSERAPPEGPRRRRRCVSGSARTSSQCRAPPARWTRSWACWSRPTSRSGRRGCAPRRIRR